jgi:acyl-CoA synthetase (AMP-forming)/AMP-acid ligase II
LADKVARFVERLQFPRKALGFHFAHEDAAGLVAYMAALESGHAVVMLDPNLDDVFMSKLISRFQPDFLIAPGGQCPEAGSDYSAAPSPEANQVLLRAKDPHRHTIHPDLTLLISTSGSTGSPKLVRQTWRGLLAVAAQINERLRNTEQDRAMVTAPIFNGYGQSVIHTHLVAGGSFVLSRERIVSRAFWEAVRESGCNSIGGTPYFYQVLDRLDLDSLNVPLLRKFIATGGRLPEHLARKFHYAAVKRGGTMHLMYGQAEATARITGLAPELLPEAARSIGSALSGGRLWIELNGVECGPREEGELIYQGPGVMMGYATEPADLAKGDQLGGRLATGDLGYRDENGLFYITGRKARFAKLFGWRVSLDDIEEILSRTGRVAAINEQDRVLIFTERRDAAFDEAVAELSTRLRIHPSAFEVRHVPAIPILANGKTDYRSLVTAFDGPPAQGSEPAAGLYRG